MYALAVNGSPREGGNTEILLKTVLGSLAESGWNTELVKVGGTAIRGCTACYKCFENKDNHCIIDNDGFNEVYAKLLKADAMILGSPTYFAAVSADLKALLERAGLVAIANNNAFSGKIGAAVVAVRRGGATHVFDSINHMYQMSRMVVPGSTYWNMGIGRGKEEVLEDDEGMNNMRHLGQVINWLGQSIKNSQLDYPAG
ncbi:MAG: flavodoxin family protein [Desulfuromusa sp.]|jgi:multimeric flavodoxin WrbA|nr:flavodoxin family protein [Desulfuromusa sp.]